MFKIHYTSGYAEVVETVDEAVGIVRANDAFVSVLNRPKMGATEAERTIYERISCLDADDEWVGARFEADVVPREWRIARKGIWLGRSNIPGHLYQKVRMTQVRV